MHSIVNSPHNNYVAGEWIQGNDYIKNINPSDVSHVIGEYALGDARTVDTAVAASKQAEHAWRNSTPQQRFDVLDYIGTELLSLNKKIGSMLSSEEGKTLAEGLAEVTRAGQIFKFFAGEALRIKGDYLESVRAGVEVNIMREPSGTIGIITPWNYPLAIPAWKIAPALAFGNCVVFNPACLVPGCAWILAEIISRSNLPAGVFNLVMGRGSLAGQAIVDHPDVSGISFTGSAGVGQAIASSCASRFAKVQLEMGGKNPLVILGDADLDRAVSAAVDGAFYSTGQRCTASSRFIVTEDIHDQFVAAVVERMRALKVGHALDASTDIGPVVDSSQLNQDQDYIKIGLDEGANLASGGVQPELKTRGYYFTPALFTETDNTMRINREEIFGPVASVIKVKDYDEALMVANDTEFGLSSGIFTSSLKYATDFRKNSQAGMVMVNLPTAGVDYHAPFGGRKGSSMGMREQGQYAIEFYTTVKTAYLCA